MDFEGLPDLEEFSIFLKFLAKKKSSDVVIFTAAHQNMGYDRDTDTRTLSLTNKEPTTRQQRF